MAWLGTAQTTAAGLLLKDKGNSSGLPNSSGATFRSFRIVHRQPKERNMRAFARFILVKSHDNKELLINVAQIESIRVTKDPEVCEIHMVDDEEESFFLANHTMQDLVFVLDEAADVHIAGVRVRPEGLTLPEVESIGQKQD